MKNLKLLVHALLVVIALAVQPSTDAMSHEEAEAQWRVIENKQDFQSLHKHHRPGKREQRRVEQNNFTLPANATHLPDSAFELPTYKPRPSKVCAIQ